MKMNKNAIVLALGSLCAVAAMPAHAVKVAGDLLEVYGSLYPEYARSRYTGGPVGTAVDAGQLTTGTTSEFYSRTAAQSTPRPSFNKVQWSQSYIGFKGKRTAKGVTLGYDLQAVLTPDDTGSGIFNNTRDAFIWVGVEGFGRLQAGSMDSPYKAYGDRYRMLNVSSSNFVSTSNVLSTVPWKGGTTSFHTRATNQLQYISPTLYGVEASLGYSNNPNNVIPAGTQQQTAHLIGYGVKWENGPYYVSVQREEHRNYMAFSSSNATLTGFKAVAIANTNVASGVGTGFTTGRSNDYAQRLSLGYANFGARVGFDISRLNYSEEASVAGKFTNYKNTTWQLSAEYDIGTDWTVAAGYAHGSKGSCSLSGGVACSTAGYGGSEMNIGGMWNLDKGLGIFALANKYKNGAGGAYGSPGGTTTGGGTINMALGVSVRF